MGHIVIEKNTLPADDTDTLFTFSPSGFRNDTDFQLTSDEFCLSGELDEGTYSVSELVPDG